MAAQFGDHSSSVSSNGSHAAYRSPKKRTPSSFTPTIAEPRF
jgi:hypothetical protein